MTDGNMGPIGRETAGISLDYSRKTLGARAEGLGIGIRVWG